MRKRCARPYRRRGMTGVALRCCRHVRRCLRLCIDGRVCTAVTGGTTAR
jgi:hypothetical protein